MAQRSAMSDSRPLRISKYCNSAVVFDASIISRSRFVKSRSFGWRYWARFLVRSSCAAMRASNNGLRAISSSFKAVLSAGAVVGGSLSKSLLQRCIMST